MPSTTAGRTVDCACCSSAVALFAVAATAGGLVAVGASETAEQREAAQIEALTSTALSLGETDRDVAALLAVEAHRVARRPSYALRALAR